MTTDRDQSIERLLRGPRALEPQGAGACPDAETLAALADGALAADVRRVIERHIADCHHCQALTAAMVRADVSERVTGGMALPWWKGAAVKWLVPAAAAATAVALWVAIPTQRTSIGDEAPLADAQVPASPPAAAPPEASVPSARDDTGSAAVSAEAPGSSSRQASRSDLASADGSAAPVQRSREEADGRAAARNESVAVQQEKRFSELARVAESPPAAGAVIGARTAVGIDVISPDPQRRWRVGPGSSLQQSVDGGGTWTRQETGASAELTAGSAPTPNVCWLVGRGGLVLRTTDGGSQWQRIAFPENVDFAAVAASSALLAVVDTADGRRLRTTDGGLTWVPVQRP